MKNNWVFGALWVTLIVVGCIIIIYCVILYKNHNKDNDYCWLYAFDKTNMQHNFPLLKEINKEAQEYYNVSYDFNPSPKKQVYVTGDGRASSWYLDPETNKPIIANCVFEGIVQEGDIRLKFEVTKEINISELKQWKKQYDKD